MRSDIRQFRRGFTLFEVAIALLVMAMGVMAVVALLPRSLEQLNLARQKIYAASIAMDLSSHFTYGYVRNNKIRNDDYHLAKIAGSPDIERCATSYLASPVDYRTMAPVPPEILLRLDSDDDRIRRLVLDGVPVFYALPRQMDATRPNGTPAPDGKAISSGQVEETAFESQGAELGQIIFAVDGDPQLNADWQVMHHTMARGTELLSSTGNTRFGRSWPWFIGGGYSGSGQAVNIAHDNTNVATASVPLPLGLSRGVLPRKGYFWDYPVRVLDWYTAWPASGANGGDAINLALTEAAGKYSHREDRSLPVSNDTAAMGIGQTDSLFQPFKAAERCRQIVFWSVNWKSFEDAEEAMPADWDISAFNAGTKNWQESHSVYGYNDGVGHPEISPYATALKNGAVWGPDPAVGKKFSILWRGNKQALGYNGDPALSGITFSQGYFNWADVFCSIRGENAGGRPSSPHVPEPLVAGNNLPNNPADNWWFDRNFNGRRDVGPIPRGTRLRARTIGRYNVYDPRLHLVLR